MGGRAFIQKYGIESKRLNNTEYGKIWDKIRPNLLNIFNKVEIVRSYSSKDSHGDLDCIVSNTNNQNIGPHDLRIILGGDKVHRNGQTTSILIDGFQVDVTFIVEDEFDAASFYFNDSPAGNLLGKLAHSLGFHLGHNGLYYKHSKDNIPICTVTLSKNSRDICGFLDVAYNQKQKGFTTQQEIFEWICASKYFHPELFSFDRMNHTARTRDRKRPDYNQFLDYIKDIGAHPFKELSKASCLNIAAVYFKKDIGYLIEQAESEYFRKKDMDAKLNGHTVMEVTGLQGKDVGMIISKYNTYVDVNFFANNSAEEIKEHFKAWYKSYVCMD